MTSEADYEVVIVGAGVVGLAVAWALAKSKVTSVLVIEKESSYGRGPPVETVRSSTPVSITPKIP